MDLSNNFNTDNNNNNDNSLHIKHSTKNISNLLDHVHLNMQDVKDDETTTDNQKVASFQIVLKNNFEGIAIIPGGSYEYQQLLQQYMLKPNYQGKKALICAPNVTDQ